MTGRGWLGLVALGVSGAASAQTSSVNLYGVIDVGVEYATHVNAAGNNLFSMTTGNLAGSRWGLRGIEDLGGGLQGIFVLESGFATDTGTSSQGGRLFGRNAFVGLKDAQLGQLTLGRHVNTLWEFTVELDPMGIATRYSLIAHDQWLGGRADNSVKYTGNFGPVDVKALYSFGYNATTAGAGEVPGNSKVGREMGATLGYTNGPLRIATTYDIIYGRSVATQSDREQRALVAASYDFAKAKAYLGYRWYDGRLGQQSSGSNLWWAGVKVPVTPALAMTGSVYYQDFKGTNADPMSFVLAADYGLSKRTFLYTVLSYAWNRHGSALGVTGINGGTLPTGNTLDLGSTAVTQGKNQIGVVTGIRHIF
ncbi:porin [Cupriavidus sp. TMH.W2]|uniref:porin n=1 Tax=Cupriavidus sp. TMH.W2 TaxID=3434465 RepID=UPI003D789D2C